METYTREKKEISTVVYEGKVREIFSDHVEIVLTVPDGYEKRITLGPKYFPGRIYPKLGSMLEFETSLGRDLNPEIDEIDLGGLVSRLSFDS